MSKENVEVVRHGVERFAATGDFIAERVTADFVWDMSNFHGWPEQQVYEGADGANFPQRVDGCVGGLGT